MQRENRRLAAIVAADIAGYSRLIGQDEEGTLQALRAIRMELTDPLIQQYGGRIANTAGDSLLLEFPSAVDAVRCSIALQEGMAERNADLDENSRIEFRIGINVGDVVAQGDDLLGDGVNVAARLEGLAEPGGICISRRARDQVRDRMEIGLEDLGEVEVRNIARPVRAFRVLRDTIVSSDTRPSPKSSMRALAAVTLSTVVVVVGVAIWFGVIEWKPLHAPPPTGLTAPSIAVLPFKNLSAAPNFEALANGLALQISGQLAKAKFVRVIGVSSMAGIDLQNADPTQIRKSIGQPVDYVFTASIQADAERARIIAELLSAEDGRQVWSRPYDGKLPLKSFLDYQENTAHSIVTAISGGYGILAQIDRNRIDRSAGRTLNEYECTLLTFLTWERGVAPEFHLDARNCWEGFIEGNKQHADALGWLAALYYFERSNNINVKPKSFERMRDVAERAVAIDPKSQIANYGFAISQLGLKNDEEFLAAAKRTIDLDAKNVSMVSLIAFLLHRHGQKTEAVSWFQKAIELDPFPPFWYVLPLYENAFDQEDYKTALELSLKFDPPGFVWTYIRRASYYAGLGNLEKAAENADRVLELEPDFAETYPDRLRTWEPDVEIRKRSLRLLRAAGIDVKGEGS